MSAQHSRIRFFSKDVPFVLKNKRNISTWLNAVAKKHKRTIGSLDYIFVNDDYLLEINRQFLKHDTLTDIITFDYSSEAGIRNQVNGEIYISLDRVADNAGAFSTTKKEELLRVMAHGLLHLCGFRDKTSAEKKQMRAEEEKALALHQS